MEGKPRQVKWYKNGQELAPSAGVELKEDVDSGVYSLLIPSSTKADGAAYRVVLTGDRGDVYSGAIAHVKVSLVFFLFLSFTFLIFTVCRARKRFHFRPKNPKKKLSAPHSFRLSKTPKLRKARF